MKKRFRREAVRLEKTPGKKRRLTRPVVRVFLLTLACLLLLTAYIQYNRGRREDEQMAYVARTVSAETYETMLSQLSKTRVLEAYLMETGGDYRGFGDIARILLEEDCVRNVLFAPNGVVAAAYPLAGNENVIGLDMSGEGAGNKEARAAVTKGELYMAGPFELVQGGMGIAGRLPVYLTDGAGVRRYWGIVSVTLDYPAVLSKSSVASVGAQGFACEMWRIDPDTGEKQNILSTAEPLPAGRRTRDYPLTLFNSTWTVSIAPLRAWYARWEFWLLALGSLLVSLLAGFVAWNMEKVRQMKAEEAAHQILELRRQLDREQTNMLLSQISSHFFYHTLNSLQALIVLQPDDAYKMAGDFSRYLRFSVDSITAAGGLGSFREELRAVRAYADINRLQLGDRLNVVYRVPDEDFLIPVLTLEPIVENAILHGIKPKVGGGTVTVTLEDDGTSHVVTVGDDGVGFDPAVAFEGRSVGLANVRRRVAQFPGCGIRIESEPGAGTKVVLIYKKYLQEPG
jgi:two-component system LytT family sensor kinase